MNPTVGLMYFSPTGTTRRVCEEIAVVLSTKSPVRMDLTKPQTSAQSRSGVNVWVVGVPVYASRMSLLARQRITEALENVPAGIPAIAVALYGNVDVGVGLKQLVDLLSQKGLRVIGAGEFLGMHYFKKFHGITAKGAEGRPNMDDLAVARELGSAVLKKGFEGSEVTSVAAIQSAKVAFKYKSTSEKRVLGLLGPSVVDASKCTKCQACVRACPVACIDAQTLVGDTPKGCLGCGGCIRVCPNNARSQDIKMKWLVKRMAKAKNPPAKSVYYV